MLEPRVQHKSGIDNPCQVVAMIVVPANHHGKGLLALLAVTTRNIIVSTAKLQKIDNSRSAPPGSVVKQ